MIGIGLIGGGLAEAALGRGDQVVVYNRTAEKARALQAKGARVAATPAEAVAGVERVHLALSDDAAVDALLAACEAAIGDAVVVDHTTASTAGTAARAARLEERGIAFLHAPVFMSPAMCLEARGIMLAAGPERVFERVAGGLAAMTGSLEYLGERRDLAAAYKLFGNAMIVALCAGLADVYAMAAELGIAATDAHALFGKFNPAGVLAYRGKSMAEGDYRPSFALTMARKDVRLMLEAAGGRKLAALPAIAERMTALIEAGYGADDLGALAVESVPPRR
jgi:3-hydroxyisobutyrate dehydrogenase-like beta-hydroxyacid dehydrogenase